MFSIDRGLKIALTCLLLFSGILIVFSISSNFGDVSAEDPAPLDLNLSDNNSSSTLPTVNNTTNSTNLTNATKGCILLGENKLGKVEKLGPYGNTKSKIRIAYIIGVHPLEYQSHQAVYENIKANNKSLKYCYYIYRVTVTKDAKDYKLGRNNGQYLARDYLVPEVKKQRYNLVIDVHSNRGTYAKKRFVFAPLNAKNSKALSLKIKSQLKWMSYYYPKSQTSPPYVTNPLVKAGTKTIVFENYMYQSYSLTKSQALAFIKVVDKLKL